MDDDFVASRRGSGRLSAAASADLLSSASDDDPSTSAPAPAAGAAALRSSHHRPLRGSRSAGTLLARATAGPPGATPSLIDRVVLAEWAARAAAGLFRYGVAGVPTKVVPGPHGFVASYNEGRLSKKRPTEFTAEAVVQAFDPARFNFQKAPQREVLAAVAADGAPGTAAAWAPDAPVAGDADPSLLLINVSPIEYGHVLLVPRVMSGLPQLIDPASMALALRFAAEADNPYLRLCYNSLGAYGTVNHLHFQAYFLGTPFAVEVAPAGPLPGEAGSRSAAAGFSGRPGAHGARVRATVGYPARALVFEAARGDLGALANAIAGAAARLAAANVPHNLFVVDCGQRAFLFPNRFGAAKAAGRVPEDLLATAVDPACFELAGHMVFKRAADFEGATEAGVWRLLAAASPDEADFAAICDVALGPVEE
jgi:GDP-L-galactose phosphorylase